MGSGLIDDAVLEGVTGLLSETKGGPAKTSLAAQIRCFEGRNDPHSAQFLPSPGQKYHQGL
jgi:hypothetical protein